MNYEEIRAQSAQAVRELLAAANLRPGSILVVGCSSSEIVGSQIGHGSSLEAAQAVYEGIAPVLREAGVFLAAQCCEHLNRAIILEEEALPAGAEPVNVIPPAQGGRQLCHHLLAAVCPSGGAGGHPGGCGHGHRRHPDRHASEGSGRAGASEPAPASARPIWCVPAPAPNTSAAAGLPTPKRKGGRRNERTA